MIDTIHYFIMDIFANLPLIFGGFVVVALLIFGGIFAATLITSLVANLSWWAARKAFHAGKKSSLMLSEHFKTSLNSTIERHN